MGEFSNSVMIALLPTTKDWCHISPPHLTLVYAGETSELPSTAFNSLAKAASSLSMDYPPLILKVLGVEVFGQDTKVDVLRLQATRDLLAMRAKVIHWSVDTHPDYKPHATIGPEGSAGDNLPAYLVFDRIMVSYGEDNVTFWLDKQTVTAS